MAKVKISALRQLHSHLTDILGAYDAAKAKENGQATDDESDISPVPVSGQDSAHSGGLPMHIGFPGFRHNGPTQR